MSFSIGRLALGGDLGRDGRRIFVVFCAYYVFATYLLPSVGSIQPFSLSYVALVVPGWIFVWLSRRALFHRGSVITGLWWIFIGAALLVSLIQGNASLAYNGLYLGLVAIAIINSQGYLRTEELNAIFLAAVAGSVIVYFLGATEYGFLPGQASAPSCHRGLAFRISLFRVPSESAVLSLFVLIWNTFFPPKGSRAIRWAIMGLAAYFLAFSGIRTAIIALLVISPALIYVLIPGKRAWVRVSMALLIPACIVAATLYQLVMLREGEGNSFLVSYVLRSDSCEAISSSDGNEELGAGVGDRLVSGSSGQLLAQQGISINWLATTFNRHCVGQYQLQLFLEHPFTGNRVVRPADGSRSGMAGCTKAAISRYCDACVLATYWLSKGGIAGVVLIFIYLITFWMALRRRNLFGVVALAAFGLIMQGWGVMFAPYNFTFYMLASLVPLIGIGGPQGRPAATLKGNL